MMARSQATVLVNNREPQPRSFLILLSPVCVCASVNVYACTYLYARVCVNRCVETANMSSAVT